MLIFLNTICFIVFILIVWFKTDAYVQYCKLLNFKILLLGFNKESSLTFPQHLYITCKQKNNCNCISFLIHLITCPVCVNVWLCIGCSFFVGGIVYTPLLYITSLLIYLLFDRLLS
jgi:hypothetical protein